MLLGFSFCETMSGNYWRLDAPTEERAISVTLEARLTNVVDLLHGATWQLRGTLDAERLASGREVQGSVSFRLLSEKRVPYRLSFEGDDGRRYELCGQKEWSLLSPIDSLTMLPASLFDSDREVGRATLRFDPRSEWVPWMRSLRLRWDRA